jgi:hypothetical protein
MKSPRWVIYREQRFILLTALEGERYGINIWLAGATQMFHAQWKSGRVTGRVQKRGVYGREWEGACLYSNSLS